MPKRPSKLKFSGRMGADGVPVEFFADVPARDLEEADIALLSDERLAEIQTAPEGRKPLYRAVEAPKSAAKAAGGTKRAAAAGAAKTKPASAPADDAAPASEPSAAGDQA